MIKPERLTEYVTENCSKPFYRFRSDGEIYIRYRYCLNIEKAIDKLAEYENTGLEPKEVEQLKHDLAVRDKELEELKKNAPKFKSGDKVYYLTKSFFTRDINDFNIGKIIDTEYLIEFKYFDGNKERTHCRKEFVFVTRKEAEEALKKLEE